MTRAEHLLQLAATASGFATPIGASDDEVGVKATLTAVLKAFDDLDLTAFMRHFDDGASFFAPNMHVNRLDGRERIADFFSRVFDDTRRSSGRTHAPYIALDAVDLRIQLLGNAAVATFHLPQTDARLHRRTFVFVRRSDGWRIAHLHASNVAP